MPKKRMRRVARLQSRLGAVKERLKDIPHHSRVFFEVRAEPLTGAGAGSIVQEILTAAGAENALKSDRAIVLYNFEALLIEAIRMCTSSRRGP